MLAGIMIRDNQAFLLFLFQKLLKSRRNGKPTFAVKIMFRSSSKHEISSALVTLCDTIKHFVTLYGQKIPLSRKKLKNKLLAQFFSKHKLPQYLDSKQYKNTIYRYTDKNRLALVFLCVSDTGLGICFVRVEKTCAVNDGAGFDFFVWNS